MERAHDTQELARIFGVQARTVRNWLKSGALPGIKLGRSWFADEAAIRERLRGRGDTPHVGAAAEGR